ncbi:MAG: hypothetical protein N4A49_06410 [Marinifilaceae bacterium]|jgi:hypothetical protein|nr:hypothetical protein [Marinifilaceae bacterium]
MDDFEKLRWNTARYQDSRMLVLMNEFTNSFPIFSSPYIHSHILNIPASIIKGGVFQTKLVRFINAEMLNMPLFSHRRMYKVNDDNTRSKILSLKNLADFVFKYFSFFKKPLVDIYRRLKYRKFTKVSSKVYMEIKELDENSYDAIKSFNGYVGWLYNFRQFLIGDSYIKRIVNKKDKL